MSPPGLAIVFAAAILALAGIAVLGEGLMIKGKAILAQRLLENAWERRLAGDASARAWAWADVTPAARLIGPDGETDIVLSDASGEAMAFGPGLMTGTPYPGEAGTAIVAAHRDTHFRYLKDTAPGDIIRVETVSGERLVFRVTETRIVDANASGIDPWDGPARLALVTCYPFDAIQSGPLRFVAFADLVKQD